jgi:hypothetical protein
MKAYFDGSGSEDSHFLVLTGVVTKDALWSKITARWQEILVDREPKAPYLHMRELISLNGAFSSDKGWNETNTSQLVWDCLMYAQNLKESYRSFTCTIDMEAYRDIISRRLQLPSAHAICNRYSAEEILKWYVHGFVEHHPEKLDYIFDRGESFMGKFQVRWSRKRKSGKGFFHQWHLIKTVCPGEMEHCPGIQLADLIAWSHHRRLMCEKTGANLPWRTLSETAEAVLPSTRRVFGRKELAVLAMYRGTLPEHTDEIFGE